MVKDYKGDVIEVGTIVAFNLSGNVRLGEVLKIRKSKSRPGTYPAEIRTLYAKTEWISKVKDVQNCSVIFEKVP